MSNARFNRRHVRVTLPLLTMLVLTAAACGSSGSSSDGGSDQPEEDPYRVALLSSDFNDDHNWGQAHATGAREAAEKAGVELELVENVVDPADVEQQAAAFASDGYDLILIVNGGVPDSVVKLAEQFPDVMFCGMAMQIEDRPENLCTYNVQFEVGTFLAGALAGQVTESNFVGGVGGFNFPVISSEIEGFILGARYVNPAIESSSTYIDTLSDVGKGEAAASALIAAGADVLISATGQATQGMIKAAEAKEGTYIIAQYFDAHELGPNVVLTTALHNLDGATGRIIELGASGELTNEDYVSGPAEGVGTLAPYQDLEDVVPSDAQRRVELIEEMIIQGELEVPFLGKPGAAQQFDLSQLPPVPE